MGQSKLSNSSAQCRWSGLAATQIKSQTTVNLLLKVQFQRQGEAYLPKERVIDIHHKCRGQRGASSSRWVRKPNADNLRASLEYVACFCFCFSIKLVFYYVAIDNYYLCFGTVPKVAKNFF